jgi:hypothetical protein
LDEISLDNLVDERLENNKATITVNEKFRYCKAEFILLVIII